MSHSEDIAMAPALTTHDLRARFEALPHKITMDWPHPEIGVAPELDESGFVDLEAFANNHVYVCGFIVYGDGTIQKGRVYTEAEWSLVGEDVERWLEVRNAALRDDPSIWNLTGALARRAARAALKDPTP